MSHIQANISQTRWSCESYQATVRDSSFGGLVSHIKHQLKSGISEAFRNLRATLQSIQFSIRSSYPYLIHSSEPILGSFTLISYMPNIYFISFQNCHPPICLNCNEDWKQIILLKKTAIWNRRCDIHGLNLDISNLNIFWIIMGIRLPRSTDWYHSNYPKDWIHRDSRITH